MSAALLERLLARRCLRAVGLACLVLEVAVRDQTGEARRGAIGRGLGDGKAQVVTCRDGAVEGHRHGLEGSEDVVGLKGGAAKSLDLVPNVGEVMCVS